MKKIFLLIIIYFMLQLNLLAQSPNPNPYWSGGMNIGYNTGLGFQGNLTISNFAQDFPFSARFGIEYTSMNPGTLNKQEKFL